MKRWQKITIIVLASYIGYYGSITILNKISSNQTLISDISTIMFILPVIIYFMIIKTITKKQNDKVSKVSTKIQKINELNSLYDFKKIIHQKRSIAEREYSRKSFARVTGSSILKYHIENDINGIRTDIENALHNLEKLENYEKDLKEIINEESVNQSEYSLKKYIRIEQRVINNIIYKKDNFTITLKLEAYYRSNGGNVNESKKREYEFYELVDLYNEWKNGKKYEETAKQERKIMNDDIRYNVLKRDGFACKICGQTAKDGAKLHVDHIIPITEGGKTVMSNLQTLCDRCNIGKSNKIDKDFEDNMICPFCGSKLVKRKGKYGDFIGCSKYPKCKYKKKQKEL